MAFTDMLEEFFTPIAAALSLNVSGDVVDISGCTDINAENYTPNATSDDGSHIYLVQDVCQTGQTTMMN